MTEFEYDIYNKKKMTYGAKHKKNGMNSKKCTLSSDKLTKKQWDDKCGEVVSYQLNIPYTWEEFLALPKDIQKMYIIGLKEKYNTNSAALSRMFKKSRSSISKYLKDNLDLGQKNRTLPKSHMSAEQNVIFNKFIGYEGPMDDKYQ